ncbi:MAG: hypothetical protein CM15mP127_13020 [Gammaproteobacteria bacterium]|nr:MAG: hypothetical protein CM15mP127_13020 [Gammaproteobacteria bacterium]
MHLQWVCPFKFEKEQNINKVSSFCIRSAGRLTTHKGYDMLLKSLKNLREDFYLEIAGDGPEYSALNSMIKNNLQKKCKLVGDMKIQLIFLLVQI